MLSVFDPSVQEGKYIRDKVEKMSIHKTSREENILAIYAMVRLCISRDAFEEKNCPLLEKTGRFGMILPEAGPGCITNPFEADIM